MPSARVKRISWSRMLPSRSSRSTISARSSPAHTPSSIAVFPRMLERSTPPMRSAASLQSISTPSRRRESRMASGLER